LAYYRSFNLLDPLKLPVLIAPLGYPDLSTYYKKAKVLVGRFFPSPEADLTNILNPDLVE
jgi:hypothetical protein